MSTRGIERRHSIDLERPRSTDFSVEGVPQIVRNGSTIEDGIDLSSTSIDEMWTGGGLTNAPNLEIGGIGVPASDGSSSIDEIANEAVWGTSVREQILDGLLSSGRVTETKALEVVDHPIIAEAERLRRFQMAMERSYLTEEQERQALLLFTSGQPIPLTSTGQISIAGLDATDGGALYVSNEVMAAPAQDPRTTAEIVADYAKEFNEGLADLNRRYGQWVGYAADAFSLAVGGPIKFMMQKALGRGVEEITKYGLDYAASIISRELGVSDERAAHLAIFGVTVVSLAAFGWRSVRNIFSNLGRQVSMLTRQLRASRQRDASLAMQSSDSGGATPWSTPTQVPPRRQYEPGRTASGRRVPNHGLAGTIQPVDVNVPGLGPVRYRLPWTNTGYPDFKAVPTPQGAPRAAPVSIEIPYGGRSRDRKEAIKYLDEKHPGWADRLELDLDQYRFHHGAIYDAGGKRRVTMTVVLKGLHDISHAGGVDKSRRN